ncbi:MAG: outer membrane beta-barrel protein [Terracidiphilus sp.]
MKREFRTRRAIGTALVVIAVHLACYGQSGPTDTRKTGTLAHKDSVQESSTSMALMAVNEGGQSMDASMAKESTTADAAIAGQAAAPAALAVASGAVPKVKPGFFARWGKAYLMDWAGTTPTDPNAPQRRGTPPPIPAPPYPASDWPMGGTQEIGAPDYSSYQLQEAIDGDPIKLSKIKWYGWISVGANGSTNNRGNASKGIGANAPSAYDVYPNTVVLDQLALYTERLADTVQKDHFDWGFRLTNLYGQDYRYTTSHGIFSQQLLVKNAQYGYDPVMWYADLYFPKLGQGADLRIGRYISLPDIEAQLAPNNYTYSHSILYTYDCYTMVGANLTVKVNDNWTVQGGLSGSCDTAPWTSDARLTGNVCLIYTWHNGGDTSSTCDNTINNGKYGYNNLTAFYETWYHSISPHWHTDMEGWYQYMSQTPNMWWINTGVPYNKVSSPWPENTSNNRFVYPGDPGSAPSTPSTLNFGAVCENPNASYTGARATYCYAPEWAITNYIEHNFWNNTASLNIRSEVVDDIKGQRTGTPAIFEEHMVGFDFWAGTTVTFRPELSYTHAFSPYGLRALDINPGASVSALQNAPVNQLSEVTMRALGAKTQALTIAADIIWHF